MATLEKIRSRSGLLIAVVGIALAAFVVGDAINSWGASAGSDMRTVGSVEGVEFSSMDFQDEVNLFSEISRMQSPRNLSDGDMRDEVWNGFVRSTLLKKKAEELGITVTKSEVMAAVLGENVNGFVKDIPLFKNAQGVFDQNAVRELLQFANSHRGATDGNGNLTEQAVQAERIDKHWKYWSNQIEDVLLYGKVCNLLAGAMSPTKKDSAFMADLYSKNYDVVVCKKAFSDVADSTISVSDSDINACYSKNKENYKVEEGYRSLKLIAFPIEPSQDDADNLKASMEDVRKQLTEVSDSDVPLLISSISDANSQYNGAYMSDKDVDYSFKDFAFTAGKGAVADVVIDGAYYKTAKVMSDVVSRPDSVRISLVLVRAATLEETQKKADSLMALVNGGVAFDSLRSVSAADQSIVNSGDLGWVKEGLVGIPNFDSLAFSADKGKVFTLNSNNGIHLVKVTDKTAPVKKVKLAVASSMLQPSSATANDVYNNASQFVAENATLSDFEAAAKEKQMMVIPVNGLGENAHRAASMFGVYDDLRDLVRWAWDEDRVVGDVSGVYGVNNNTVYVVAALSDIVDKGYAQVGSVRSDLEAKVRKEKKAELLVKDIASVSEDNLKDTLKAVRFGLNNLPRFGGEKALVGAICTAAEGQVVKPIVGNSGVFAFKVLSSATESEFAFDKKTLVNEVWANISQSLFRVLKSKGEVKDNRAMHY